MPMTHHRLAALNREILPGVQSVAVFEHHLPENRVLLSDGFARLVGLDPEESRRNPAFWSERMHPEDSARVRAAYDAFLTTGAEDFEARYRVRHRDGHWVHVLARIVWERRDGPVAGVLRGHVLDLSWTERMRLQAEIIERIGEGVMLLSRDGVIHFVNPAFEAMMRYPPGTLAGRHSGLLSFRSPLTFEGLLKTVFDGTEKDSSVTVDLEGKRRDGTLQPLHGRFSSVDLDGERHVVGVMSDITARKQLERDMMQVATRVQQRVGGDLHEGLGQQLSGIAMLLQGLRQRAALLDGPSIARELDEAVALLNGAISRTRLLARGLSPVRPSTEGIKEGFEELVNNVHEVYGLRVRLELDLPDDLTVDENPVTNLFHIAREAVENAASHARARDIKVEFAVSGQELSLLVEDDGIGFDVAQEADSGMGLRMMRFRAEMARGYLAIESRPGGGTCLRCRCPARTEAHP
jgi:PAS domain S-box-containing protein